MSAFATAITWPRPTPSDEESVSYKHLTGGTLDRTIAGGMQNYLVNVQRVFLDKGLDKFFRSDVTESLLGKETEKREINSSRFRIHQSPVLSS